MNLKEELERDRKRKNSIEYEIFENILNQCKEQIRFENNLGRTSTKFTVPSFLLGYPIFSYYECKNYLINELVKTGIKIKEYENYISISWKSETTENIKKIETIKKERTIKREGTIFTKDDELIFIRKK